jgi:hypothetical protein
MWSHSEAASRRKILRTSLLCVGVAATAGLATEVADRIAADDDPTPATMNINNLLPSQLVDLTPWKISLPYGAGTTQVQQPQLNKLTDSYFKILAGVQFTVPVNGTVQPGADYPRSELREMNTDGTLASWATNSGTHTMSIVQRITHLPKVKSQLIAGQIHDATEYVILIRLDSAMLHVDYNGASVGVLDPTYALGSTFTVKVVAGGGYIDVYYNGVRKVHQAASRPGCYFKAGCYLQTNPSKGDAPSDFGQVEIFDLNVQHVT